MFPKYSHMIAQNFWPTLLTILLRYAVSSSFKSGNQKIIKKSIPDSVKYSLGVFDQCKQPQRYSSLELSFFVFWNDFFNQLMSQRVHGSSSILLKLSSCMYVCSRNTAKTVHDSTKILGPPYSPFAYGVQYQVSFKSGNKKNYKKQFLIQSSTLQENLINANNLSGIVHWSYLVFFSWNDFFSSTAVTTGTQRVHGSSSII